MEQFKLHFLTLTMQKRGENIKMCLKGIKKSVLFMQDYLKRLIQYHKHYYLDYCQYKHGMAVALKHSERHIRQRRKEKICTVNLKRCDQNVNGILFLQSGMEISLFFSIMKI